MVQRWSAPAPHPPAGGSGSFTAHVRTPLADHAHRLALLILDLRTERHAAAIGIAYLDQQRIAFAGIEAQVADGTGERRDRLAGTFQLDVMGHALRVEGDGVEAVRRYVRNHCISTTIYAQARGVADDRIARTRRFHQHHGVAPLRVKVKPPGCTTTLPLAPTEAWRKSREWL